ncbi:pectinesterase-like [Impatiens glandulifera]|uniref:pectinesterase-like n=1 Tax=Impatiens glandulifera TaxID=253017 RepID=UPI001FB191D7|nr:pectinesterase-like [Impatiens glandulifera]
MDNNYIMLVLLPNVFLLAYWSPMATASTTTDSFCGQTPYPDLCHPLTEVLSLDHAAFRGVAMEATLQRAKQAHSLISSMDLTSLNEPQAKLAWLDCMDLYEDTVVLVNQTLHSTNPIDAQTWLSAAITNYHTCKNGFYDFQLSAHLESFPVLFLADLSKFLSNALAINKNDINKATKGSGGRRRLLWRRRTDGFPEWLGRADRRLLQSSTTASNADIVVAKDGSGNYETIAAAVAAAASKGGGQRVVIHVKAGVYKENVQVKRSMKKLMFVGDGIGVTVVTGSKSNGDGSTTYASATVGIMGNEFIARDMTFENTAGPQKHQAVALRSGSDHSVFYSCEFKGYQDTLYVYAQRQFYRDCDIHGTVDFIFGDASVVLQNCNIYVRKPMGNQQNSVTAQGRTDPNQNTGIVIHNSRITASSDLRPVQGSIKTYLGRPWQKYSRTIIMKCAIDGVISPAGWSPWSGSFALSTLYYAEYSNTGAGASTGGRVKWPGFHVISDPSDVAKFTVGNFLDGSSWIPGTGVPFTSGI